MHYVSCVPPLGIRGKEGGKRGGALQWRKGKGEREEENRDRSNRMKGGKRDCLGRKSRIKGEECRRRRRSSGVLVIEEGEWE